MEATRSGELRVLAPQLLWLELLNVAARRWGWPQAQLEQLAVTLEQLGFELLEPELLSVARWAATGLTAYDAVYVAVAEQAGAQLITDDEQIVAAAPKIATALGDLQVPLNVIRALDFTPASPERKHAIEPAVPLLLLTSSHLPERCWIPGGKRRSVVWRVLSLSAPSVWANLTGRGLARARGSPAGRGGAAVRRAGGAQLMKNCW